MKNLFLLLFVLGVTFVPAFAQDTQPASQPSPATTEDQDKEKAEREKNAYRLLDQVIDEAQSLHLTENRVRVQITAADLLWDNNQGRARSLFAMAAEGVNELNRNQQSNNNINNNNNRRGGQSNRNFQLRQDLVLAAARHDAQLAYQLLNSTKTAPPIEVDQNARNRIQLSPDDSLEQTLLGRIAALDPKLAATNAKQMLDKGTFPRTLPDVLAQLQKQDADAAAKLGDETVKKLEAANMLSNSEAANLAQLLLMAGPRAAADASATATTQTAIPGRAAVLDQSTYVDLMGTVVDLALKATPATQTNQPRQFGGRFGGGQYATATNTQPTDAQIEQNGARRLLGALQSSLSLVDQYLPSKSSALRQKLNEIGAGGNLPMNFTPAVTALLGNASTDVLLQTAANAPLPIQSRLYQQAAYKALDDGDTEKARQIATDHLQANVRDAVMQRIDFRELARKADGAQLEQIHQLLARAQTDDEKLDLLLQIAGDAQQANPKLAMQLLEEARQMTNRRATDYEHFVQQLKVAHAFETVDPARSVDVLDPGISQLNELFAAAAVLNGFEMNLFRDGELSMQSGNGLTSMVNRYGEELAQLARIDAGRSETLAGHFQLVEPRIMVRLAIVQGLLGRTNPTPATPAFAAFRN